MLGLSILKSKVVIIKNNNKIFATFDNYVRAGIIPKGKKEIGFNELSWSLKDFDGVKLQRIHKK